MTETDASQGWEGALPEGARPKQLSDSWIFDRITVEMKPRYKTSPLSGDEWRVSGEITFWRNGEKVHREHRTDIKTAIRHLPWLIDDVPMTRNLPVSFAPDPEVCFQPGCDREPVATYLIKQEFCTGGGNCAQEIDPRRSPLTGEMRRCYRRFCQEHLRRGDCGLEDRDANYEVVHGPGPDGGIVDPKAISESAFGGVVTLPEDSDD